MTKMDGKTAKRIGVRMVPLEDQIPNALNATSMSEELQEKLKAHIRRTGLTPFLIPRPHPDQPRKFELLDGHHRAAILRELGYHEVECDLWDVTDQEARLLLA